MESVMKQQRVTLRHDGRRIPADAIIINTLARINQIPVAIKRGSVQNMKNKKKNIDGDKDTHLIFLPRF